LHVRNAGCRVFLKARPRFSRDPIIGKAELSPLDAPSAGRLSNHVHAAVRQTPPCRLMASKSAIEPYDTDSAPVAECSGAFLFPDCYRQIANRDAYGVSRTDLKWAGRHLMRKLPFSLGSCPRKAGRIHAHAGASHFAVLSKNGEAPFLRDAHKWPMPFPDYWRTPLHRQNW
jgi:hypothetical protein